VPPTPHAVTVRVTAPPAGAAAAAPPAGRPGPAGRRALLAGLATLTVALAAYAANLLSHPRAGILSWLDLRLYLAAGQVARHTPAALYHWQYRPGMRFTYPPFAALLFGGLAPVPWGVLAWAMTAASALALGLAVWLVFGALGWAGQRRAGAALAVTAVAFWTEPVQRALHWGQVDLLLMALVVWDLCQPGHRRWQGAGIGLAAAVKLVPLIFIPYLLLTRRPRQAAVALATFLALAGVGFLALPSASAQWWFGGLWLHVGRVGFAGSVAPVAAGLSHPRHRQHRRGHPLVAGRRRAGGHHRAGSRGPLAPPRPAGARLAHLRPDRAADLPGQLGSPLGVARARAGADGRRRTW